VPFGGEMKNMCLPKIKGGAFVGKHLKQTHGNLMNNHFEPCECIEHI
jgi:hypothetical protein